MLARIDAGQCEASRDDVSLEELAREAWLPCAERATARRLAVRWDLAEGLRLGTDTEKLRVILRNLFDNAVHYADASGAVGVAAKRVGERVTLRISNGGSRLSPEQARHVFERFWRGDAARGETGRHAGLGLPICRELAHLIGATISVSSQAGGEFVALLELPAETSTPTREQRDGAAADRCLPGAPDWKPMERRTT